MKNTLKYMLIRPYVTQSLIISEFAPRAMQIGSIKIYINMQIMMPTIAVADIIM